MLKRILNRQQDSILKEERQLLSSLRSALLKFSAAAEDQATLERSIQQLDELFLLVVVGEFNAGKSAFINALLGQPVLPEGVTPTTAQINLIRYGDSQERVVLEEHLHALAAPVELLQEVNIVDTPGTNAIIRKHEAITAEFVPRSDLVLFVTSADRPFTESERAFLERIRDWGKKIVVVLNKIDILEQAEEIAQIQSFIAENARALLGVVPEIYPVSARAALRAKQGDPSRWAASRFAPLEQYIHDTLDERSRVRLKLLNPLGVGAHLAGRYLTITEERLGLLREDFAMLEDVERQLDLYKEDMTRDFSFRMADIENILYEMEQRGQDYFDETMRLARLFDLLNKTRIQRDFEHKVVADAPQQIERKVNELIDWLVDADFRQWQAVTEHVGERRRQYKDRIVGDTDIGSFHFDRERLISSVGRQAQRVVETYDKAREAESIAEGARTAVAAAAGVEVVAVGLGTVITIIATSVALDVTGVLMASVVAALGLFVIPARRRQAKKEMREKVATMREKLARSLRVQFEQEIERSLQRVHEAIGPYTRFVRAEREKLTEMEATLGEIKQDLGRLKAKVEEL